MRRERYSLHCALAQTHKAQETLGTYHVKVYFVVYTTLTLSLGFYANDSRTPFFNDRNGASASDVDK